ncbi:transketolase [Thiomicrospira sp. S5]|uniref:transketolase n=1 Tax=Thiomicrospira sp. S5 TaxID=1803865 RepID=UPI000F8A02FA|nr:transketolase [Thiomicrospira sp. S5]AZR81689.1 transketolase [Thiomicrospira sp. S5]
MKDTIQLAKKIRIDAVRMVNAGGSSHIGSVLSIADILAVLYGNIMKYAPENPKLADRDRFILSKGHAGAGVYAALAEVGFFEKEKLLEHCQNGSIMSGHVSHKGIPGVELSTGALGHGLPVACGMAYSAKLDNKDHRIFVLMSDGELNEGSNWEAFMFAAHHKLNNLVAIIDRNRLQSMKTTEETLGLEPLADKLSVFGWKVLEVDGHDHEDLRRCLSMKDVNKPLVLIANTTKGKGVSFMENNVAWHYKTPTDKLFEEAINELQGA